MTLFDWLASPEGLSLVHAVILLLLALVGYLNWLTHRQSVRNSKLLNGHIEEHVMDAAHRDQEPPSSLTPSA